MNRSFVMLAKTYNGEDVNRWFWSEKYDGIRCIWDGGVSRGVECKEVPWANTLKDSRYIETRYSTGLWSRYGKPIYAPDWFLDSLPDYPLDGELLLVNEDGTIRKSGWQRISSIVKDLMPGTGWNEIIMAVIDSPSYYNLFMDGRINETNYKKIINYKEIIKWIINRVGGIKELNNSMVMFHQSYHRLKKELIDNKVCFVIEQHKLDMRGYREQIEQSIRLVVESGGEGLVIRNPFDIWTPRRTKNVLKYKPYHDDEATVVGYIWGRETELGSKLLGKMGALIVNYKGKRFELSGFTDQERELTYSEEGVDRAGKEASSKVISHIFPRGIKVTFRYRELSDTGIPKEARYLRRTNNSY